MVHIRKKIMLLDAWSELRPRGRAQLLQLCCIVKPLGRIRDKEGNQPELRETCFPAKGFVDRGGWLSALILMEADLESNSLDPLKNKVAQIKRLADGRTKPSHQRPVD